MHGPRWGCSYSGHHTGILIYYDRKLTKLKPLAYATSQHRNMGGLFVSSEKADLLGCYFVFVLQKGWRFSLKFKLFA
jgi:hypothetical protein